MDEGGKPPRPLVLARRARDAMAEPAILRRIEPNRLSRLAFPLPRAGRELWLIACRAESLSGNPGREIGGIRMEADRALNLLNDMLWNCLVVAGPILAVTLIVGVAISVMQVATQLQEMTLSYVPKLLASALLLIMLGPWMIARITDFARGLYLTIPTLAG
jgi:flagellar biosynthetic protein FliQ